MRTRSLLRLLISTALIAGLASIGTACSKKEAIIRVVTPAEAQRVIQKADPRLVVVDVRTPEEFAEGHLADAVLVDYLAADFRERIGELARDKQYVIYCRAGNRSAEARAAMQEMGFEEIYDIQGGILAWQSAGLPVEK